MITKTIAVLGGDGPGPDVVRETIRILQFLEKRLSVRFEFLYELIGASALEITRHSLPPETIKLCRKSDAVLCSYIIDDPDYLYLKQKINPYEGLPRLKKALGLFSIMSPVFRFSGADNSGSEKKPDNFDLLFIHELYPGFTKGEIENLQGNSSARDFISISAKDIERLARQAFKMASSRRGRLAVVNYAEKLKTSELWRKTVKSIAMDYPEVRLSFLKMNETERILSLEPESLDVILGDKTSGEILGNRANSISGLDGLFPILHQGISTCLFEPGFKYRLFDNIQFSNPLPSLFSGVHLLEYFWEREAASKLNTAIFHLLQSGTIQADQNIYSPSELSSIGDKIIADLY